MKKSFKSAPGTTPASQVAPEEDYSTSFTQQPTVAQSAESAVPVTQQQSSSDQDDSSPEPTDSVEPVAEDAPNVEPSQRAVRKPSKPRKPRAPGNTPLPELPISPAGMKPAESELLSGPDVRQTFIVNKGQLEKLRDRVHARRASGDYNYSQKQALQEALTDFLAKESAPPRPDKSRQREKEFRARIRQGREAGASSQRNKNQEPPQEA